MNTITSPQSNNLGAALGRLLKFSRRSVFYFLILFCLTGTIVAADLTVDSEDQLAINKIKSAYLYNFLKYINLNPDEGTFVHDKFSVCIFGENPFGSALDSLSGRHAN